MAALAWHPHFTTLIIKPYHHISGAKEGVAALAWHPRFTTLVIKPYHRISGAKEGVAALAWHPRRNCMASLGDTGAIFLWARTYSERWSAFAPGFSELQDNEARRPLDYHHTLHHGPG